MWLIPATMRTTLMCIMLIALSTSTFAQKDSQGEPENRMQPSPAGPSFSCSGNLAPAEAAICSDESLSSLDRDLAALYRLKLMDLPVDRKTQFADTEKAWVAERNECGTDKYCIEYSYKTRMNVLNDAASLTSQPTPEQATQNPPTPSDCRIALGADYNDQDVNDLLRALQDEKVQAIAKQIAEALPNEPPGSTERFSVPRNEPTISATV